MKKTTRHQLYSHTAVSLHGTAHFWSVTMSLTRGQYAWFSTQRESHQRLNVEKHSPDWKRQWLVGFTDGDGSFSVDPHRKPNGQIIWNLVYKISQKSSNTRALMKARAILGAGKIEPPTPDDMVTLRIRDRSILKKHVFPIFDHIPLLSTKHYDYLRVRHISRLLDDTTLSRRERDQRISFLHALKTKREAIAPIWHHQLSTVEFSQLHDPEKILALEITKPMADSVISLPWISGFIEAEGSFYIVRKDDTRYCHGFGLSQAGNGLLMQAIRSSLKIVSHVKFRKPAKSHTSFYSIETTNWRNIQFIRDGLRKNLVGMKSLEFRLWERTMKYRGNNSKLAEIQHQFRQLRQDECLRYSPNSCENKSV